MSLMQKILPLVYPSLTWNINSSKKTIYLTFDDGPIPQVTPWVLKILKDFQVKATFFCIGDNVKKHPDIFKQIIAQGHTVGNHTFNHLNGWETDLKTYLNNLEKCQEILEKDLSSTTKLFRPPYGKITRDQIKIIQKQGYQIIMWSNLTQDYNLNLTPKACLKKSIKQIKQGNIIVFHDSIKAQKNLTYTLPRLLEYLLDQGYSFSCL
ncbi:polysaccharide deacetylase family protein [Myroides sp. LJL119]